MAGTKVYFIKKEAFSRFSSKAKRFGSAGNMIVSEVSSRLIEIKPNVSLITDDDLDTVRRKAQKLEPSVSKLIEELEFALSSCKC